MICCLLLPISCRAEAGIPQVSAKSAVLIDTMTGSVLYEKNARQQLPMASTTKIMTAICALEHGNLDEPFEIHPSAVGVEGSSIYLAHGEVMTLRDLVYGLMLHSGNDAAVAIAMRVSGSVEAFADLMNQTAAKIGAVDTHFQNPNGLDDPQHYTTAYDLAQITRYGMKNSEFAKIAGTKETRIPWQGKENGRLLKNHNKMLSLYEGADGVKTGYTKKDGRCLVSSATRNGFQAIAVTLNAPDDWNDHTKMLNYAFDQYELCSVLQEGDYLRTVEVTGGILSEIGVIAQSGLSLPAKKCTMPDAVLDMKIPDVLEAPVGFEQSVGQVDVYVGDNLVASVPAITSGYVGKQESKKLLDGWKQILREWMLLCISGRN